MAGDLYGRTHAANHARVEAAVGAQPGEASRAGQCDRDHTDPRQPRQAGVDRHVDECAARAVAEGAAERQRQGAHAEVRACLASR
jgi:hypothetical protein